MDSTLLNNSEWWYFLPSWSRDGAVGDQRKSRKTWTIFARGVGREREGVEAYASRNHRDTPGLELGGRTMTWEGSWGQTMDSLASWAKAFACSLEMLILKGERPRQGQGSNVSWYLRRCEICSLYFFKNP